MASFKKILLCDFELRLILCSLYDRKEELTKKLGYIRATGFGKCDEENYEKEIALIVQTIERLRFIDVKSVDS